MKPSEMKVAAMQDSLELFVKVNAEVAVQHPYGIMKGELKSEMLGQGDFLPTFFVDNPKVGNVHFLANEVSYIDVRLIVLK